MAPTNDRPVTAAPKALAWAAAILLLARIVDMVSSQSGNSAAKTMHSGQLHWVALTPGTMPPLQLKSGSARASTMTPEATAELSRLTMLARSKNKIVLCEFRADWSDPCQTMEAKSLTNTQVGKIINDHFLPVQIKDVQKEVGRNPVTVSDLEKKYRIFAFPTLVAVGPDGEQLSILVGNCSSLTTYRFLSRVLYSARHNNAVARAMPET